jgi:Base plate wedge protein 53
MANITYAKTSPYFNTPQTSNYLDVMTLRDISPVANDTLFIVTSQYKHRPDLLAFDLYQDATLWWVFAMRNKDIIRDPIYDMIPGVQIYLPQASTIKKALGV